MQVSHPQHLETPPALCRAVQSNRSSFRGPSEKYSLLNFCQYDIFLPALRRYANTKIRTVQPNEHFNDNLHIGVAFLAEKSMSGGNLHH